MSRLNLIFAGSGEFGLPSLKALAERHRIVHIFSQPDRPAGRGRKNHPTPIAQYALEQSFPLTRTPDINAEPISPADLMVVIAFGQKIAPPVVNSPRFSSINLHASILPRYRGAAPINWAILRGESRAGNSIIRLADKMDAGAILGQSSLPIDPTETAGELHDRLAIDGAELLLRVVDQLQSGKAVEQEQDPAQATIAPKLSRESARIDWHRPADEIARLIRGLSPWPGCRVRLIDAEGTQVSRLTLWRAVSRSEQSSLPPGTILPNGCISGTGGSIDMLQLQPEGKKPMALADFRNGHIWPIGGILESIL